MTSQDGREVRLRSGDFTLCDALRPYHLRFSGPVTFLTLRLDRATLLRHVGAPERLVLRRIPGDNGPGLLASRLLCGIADNFDAVVDPISHPRLSSAVLDILASAYAGLAAAERGRIRHTTLLRARVLSFVEAHLGDPALSPTGIAEAFGLSRRHIHSLFESADETLGSAIWCRRLERARLALLDARLDGQTLTQIAEAHGFKTLSHFSRSFCRAFGLAPGEFRAWSRSGVPRAPKQATGH